MKDEGVIRTGPDQEPEPIGQQSGPIVATSDVSRIKLEDMGLTKNDSQRFQMAAVLVKARTVARRDAPGRRRRGPTYCTSAESEP